MQKLSAEFVAVAEEVHHIYPEGQWSLDRIKDDPGHLLFKAYGAQMPEGDWNDPGTKQGIYMMGPNGEYLEGAHAASGSASRLAERMEAALKRWKALTKEKGYKNDPVPRAAAVAPPEFAASPMVLRVFLRDLPRGKGDDSGRRVEPGDLRGKGWMAFTEWAWNQNWLGIAEPAELVPEGKKSAAVPETTLLPIVRRALVDNVRGQNPAWKPEDVKSATLEVRETRRRRDRKLGLIRVLSYRGEARMDDGTKRYAPKLQGTAEWCAKESRFLSFSLVAVGERAGAARFNQRAQDKDPAPMGILLELFATPEPEPAKKRRR